jgi:hypothetical protein
MWVLVSNTNSAAAVINVNGLGSRNIVRRGGAVLLAGDMPAQYKSLLTYNSIHNNFELYGTGFDPGSGFLPILTANTNLYVNTATGSDSLYDGTSATVSGSHGPFQTINRAMNETFRYGPSLYTMTINIAAGTYNEYVVTPSVRGPSLVLNGANKTTTFIAGATGQHTINVGASNYMTVKNLCTFSSNTTIAGGGPPCHYNVGGGATIQTDTCASSGSCLGAVFQSFTSGTLLAGNHDFNSGSASGSLFYAANGGQTFFYLSAAYNFLGPITVSSGTAYASASGIVATLVPYIPTWSSPGNVTGPKYGAILNGVISTGGQSISWLPGTVAGSLATGGQYG